MGSFAPWYNEYHKMNWCSIVTPRHLQKSDIGIGEDFLVYVKKEAKKRLDKKCQTCKHRLFRASTVPTACYRDQLEFEEM